MKKQHPSAEVIVHPECNKSVRDLADFIGSTSKMALYAIESDAEEFIVGTDDNFIYHLKKQCPTKTYYSLKTGCHGMREITLTDVRRSLEEQTHIITVPEAIRKKAFDALDKMMKIL